MLYYEFEAGGNVYKLRLGIKNIVNLEKTLGCNPLMVFGAGDRIPTITEMVAILHNSLQAYNHGITLDATYNIFEAFLMDGHQVSDFVQHIVGIYKASGILKDDNTPEEDEEDEKN